MNLSHYVIACCQIKKNSNHPPFDSSLVDIFSILSKNLLKITLLSDYEC